MRQLFGSIIIIYWLKKKQETALVSKNNLGFSSRANSIKLHHNDYKTKQSKDSLYCYNVNKELCKTAECFKLICYINYLWFKCNKAPNVYYFLNT